MVEPASLPVSTCQSASVFTWPQQHNTGRAAPLHQECTPGTLLCMGNGGNLAQWAASAPGTRRLARQGRVQSVLQGKVGSVSQDKMHSVLQGRGVFTLLGLNLGRGVPGGFMLPAPPTPYGV